MAEGSLALTSPPPQVLDYTDDEHEFHQAHEIAHNYRSDFNFRGARIIITGSLMGRHEREGHQPLIREGYTIFRDGIVETIMKQIQALK